MGIFDISSILIAVTAVSGYLNYRLLRLPSTSGTLLVALISSLLVVTIERVVPGAALQPAIETFLARIDFDQTLMHGLLCFLLFAGALHVDLRDLVSERWTVAALSTIGVLISTAVVGLLTWWTFGIIGVPLPLPACLTFGALISPTDPIAVMGLLKELRAPRTLEAQIAGESLFNDGVGVVVFLGVASLADLAGRHAAEPVMTTGALTLFALREVLGGALLGLGLGYLGYRALKSIDDHALELLITLALVMFLYSLSFWVHVSGPIGVVVAGLFIGNPGRSLAMSDRTRGHVDAFWNMVDELLNAVLFLLLGLEVFAVRNWSVVLVPALLAIPICLLARFVSVGVPIAVMPGRSRQRGLVPILTWSGLRGGISVALVLGLPRFGGTELLLASTYAVVVFSVLVQGLTVRRVLVHYGVGNRGE
jgi:CPA1 family monovalent cation:H+ antiporter